MSEDLKTIEAIFHAGIDLPSPEEQARFLCRTCGGNTALRRQVEGLLEAHARAGHFLTGDPPPGASTGTPQTAEPDLELPGDCLGPYRLVRWIGEGTFSVVYLAEGGGTPPRPVALKIMKRGMNTPQALARFESERRILGLMDHPNIARIFDAGTTPTRLGRPYFVMEWIEGIPLIQHSDEGQLTLRERLEYLIPVCRAVQHAHERGIIHRDLKPSNILMSRVDHRCVPKVIDFGIAQVTYSGPEPRTYGVWLEQVAGTPAYMSPEQATLGAARIDARADVYSLGAVLYELVVGDPPFDHPELAGANFQELLPIVQSQHPLAPSRRFDQLSAAQQAAVASRRSCGPAALFAELRTHLDGIVMKALDRDPQRRHASARALAEDLQAYLQRHPGSAVGT